MNFYEITSLRGRFWIQAARASDAYRLAGNILGEDEFALRLDPDLTLAEAS